MSIKTLFVGVLVLMIILGIWSRISGLAWDGMNLLHPDERFMVMLLPQLTLPSSINEYLNTQTSPLNPHNNNTSFYVYGTFPLLIIKILSSSLDLYEILKSGRQFTALLDIATIGCVFFIGRRIGGRLLGLASAAAYALFALPIQLSRFFTVDPFVVFFGTLSICFLLYAGNGLAMWLLSGIFLGLAISSKISAAFYLLPLLVLLLSKIIIDPHRFRSLKIILLSSLFFLTSLVTVRLFYPYLFDSGSLTLNRQTVNNFTELKRWESDTVWFPPAVQWTSIIPGFFPIAQLAVIGLGLPTFALAATGLISIMRSSKKTPTLLFVPLGIIGLIIYQSFQFAQPLRYLYPVYPLLAISVGWVIVQVYRRMPLVVFPVLFMISIWPLSVATIYHRPHSRVAASEWIKSNIPANSILSCDHWDDCLPVGYNHGYRHIELPMFNFESPEKWQDLNQKLSTLDYLVISSNRVYASTQNDPRYFQTRQFYENLFSSRLGFELIAQFASRPAMLTPLINLCVPMPLLNYGSISVPVTECSGVGIEFVDDYADETWTVYDHPKVFIFENTSR